MSEENELDIPAQDEIAVDELTVLKNRATQMGITFHPNIGLDKIKAKIEEALDDSDAPEEQNEQDEVEPPMPVEETKAEKRARLYKEAAKLVRIRVSCMNPNKKEWEGEIYTVSNSVVGTFKKYVPFDNDEGWHVPQIILNAMRERQCQIFVMKKGKDGSKMRQGKLIKELAIEVMEPLSGKDLQELARRQAMANNID